VADEPGGGSGPVSVVVGDDHDVVWVGLVGAARVASGRPVRLLGHATDARRLLALVEQRPPDVVVLDLALGDGSDPADTVSRVIAAGSRVLVYSVLDNPRLIRRALAAGAHGLSRKSEPVALTLEKIRQVAQGQLLVSPELLSMIDGDTDFVRAKLSDREREVLVLYVSGVEIGQIAAQLFVSENSAREYLRRIRVKYGEAERPASTKVDLLRRAIEDGIVPPIQPF
jgi:DNA-binding NarL/FixJ family response regulator